jgi:multicomponent Na+:H+ antiporter subunit D
MPLAPLAPLAVAVPLVGAALLAAVGRHLPRRVQDALALGAAGVSAGLSLALFVQARRGPIETWLGGWRPEGGLALGIALRPDAVGAGFAALSGVLALAALAFALRWFDAAEGHFHALLLAFLAALAGFGLTGDLFNLFVFFELMSVAAYALAGYKSEDPAALEGALHFAVVNSAGACLVLLGVALLYGATGVLDLERLAVVVPAAPRGAVLAAFALLACGFLVKAAAVPFHFWLADAHAVAPTPACVLFSGAMVVAGVYAVARLLGTAFQGIVPEGGVGPGAVLVLAGATSAALGAALAFAQRHLKRLLAFSTVSHAGILLAGAGLASARGVAAASVYALGHGLVKGALFLGAGLVLHRLRSVDEIALRGRGRGLWLPGLVLGVGGLALAGLPPFATFRGEALLHGALARAGWGGLSWVFAGASLLTGAAVLRATLRIFLGVGSPRPEAPEVGGEVSEPAETWRSRTPAPATMVVPAVGLLVLALVAGLWPGLDEGAAAAGARFAGRALTGEDAPIAPAALRAAAVALLALGLAWLVLRRRGLPAGLRQTVARVWRPSITALRALHTGRIGDSVAWLALGTALLGGACFLLGARVL